MIKFTSKGKKGTLIGIGLSYENLRRLKKGKPIYVDLTKLGEEQGELLIFAGKNEDTMAKQLESFISPNTRILGKEH